MKILMLNNEYPPLGGGTGSVNKALLELFAKRDDIRIDLITSARGRRFEQETLSENVTIHKVPVNNQCIHHSSNIELLRYSYKALYLAFKLQRVKKYDFTFAWSGVPAGVLAYTLKLVFGLPYLIRYCGPDLPGFEQRYQRIHSILRPLFRRAARAADCLVVKCKAEEELLKSLEPTAEPVHVPNGVSLTQFHGQAEISSSGPLRVLCVGRLIERKGQEHLIRAIRDLIARKHQVHLTLIGTGDDEKRLRELSDTLGTTEQVNFLGFVPREQMPTHYSNSDVFVLPSFSEGMSVAILEGMAAGLPLIITPTGGSELLVEQEVNGYVVPWADSQELSKKLEHLAENRELAQEMGRVSREKAKTFTWESIEARYLALFPTLLRE